MWGWYNIVFVGAGWFGMVWLLWLLLQAVAALWFGDLGVGFAVGWFGG